MATTRKYNYKDVEMLLASKTITTSLTDNLADLSMARTTWTSDYATDLATKIDDAIENFLGLDKKKELRDATARLAALQNPAMRDLSFIKTQIDVDFGKEAKEILKKLGFDKNLRAVQKGDQEALIQLLYAFKKGLTDEIRTQIIEKGTNPVLIDRIITYAVQLKDANISQETLKETTKVVSEEAVNAFNEIYDELIGICKIASSFYQYEPLKKEQFTFSKVVSNMNATRKTSEESTEE
jgi:hypothetical protein